MEKMELKGCINRIKQVASDLSSVDDLIDDHEDSWELVGRIIRIKSTFLYIDLTCIMSKAGDEQKKYLTDLNNNLFYYLEKLGHAVKDRSIQMTRVCHHDITRALREVISALVPPP